MGNLLDLGIKLVFILQGLGGWLAGPMKFFSFLGTEDFFLLLMPILYWCIDSAMGLRAGMLLILSSSTSDLLKMAFHTPRPYWYDSQVKALSTETSFGLPSGHAQNAVSVWGGLASSIRRRWAWILGICLVFFIGLSRIYLGVHFPTDVLAGWAIGALLLWAFLSLEGRVGGWIKHLNLGPQILACLGASLVFIALGLLIKLSLGAWVIPAAWIQNAAAAAPEAGPITPLSLSGNFSGAGLILGLALGALWLYRSGGFDAGGPLQKRALRFLVGLVGVLLFWRGLDLVFPDGEYLVAYLFRYLRYGLVGFWVAGAAPLLFNKLGLSERAAALPHVEKTLASLAK